MKSTCPFYHPERNCDQNTRNKSCENTNCEDRHPRVCKNWMKNECKFGDSCKFKHDSNEKVKNETVNVIDNKKVIIDQDKENNSCDNCQKTFRTNNELRQHMGQFAVTRVTSL